MRPYRKKRELANLIRRKLGQPVVDVLLDTTQIDDCIEQAVDTFGEFAGGIGNENTIVLISPELVLYDGTGRPTQPGPTRGRWREPVTTVSTTSSPTTSFPTTSYPTTSTGSTGTTGTSACPPSNCNGVNTTHIKAPLGNCVNSEPSEVNGVTCQVESECAGPGWCGDNLQAPHCFTETEKGNPNAEGPFWVEGDTTTKPSSPRFVFKSVYDVPSDIMAIQESLGVGYFGTGQMGSSGEALFSPLHLLMGGGGSWGMNSPTSWVDNRYGHWQGSNGGFVDIVGWEMGMQYLETFRTLYSTKISIQLMELEHKVRITPPPTSKGVIAFAATRKVAEEHLYNNLWVREYATALAFIQAGVNGSRYAGATFPGGGSFNAEFYTTTGNTNKDKLEDQLYNGGQWSEPADFYIGE